jgi:hypothetical protein
LPPDLSSIGFEHPQRDPHRGRLPGAVRADEADHGSLFDIEADPVQGDDIAETASKIDQLETGRHPVRIGN